MAWNKAMLALCLLMLLTPLPAPAQEPLPLDWADLVIQAGEENYPLGSPVEPLLAALEKAGLTLQTQEADSCLFAGKDKEFFNDELLIGTLPRGARGQDLVETFMVLGGDRLTQRGIGIGAGGDAVRAAYGEPTLEDYDLLIYSLDGLADNPQVVFVMDLDSDTVLSYYIILNTQA